jgi:hypothetical protein
VAAPVGLDGDEAVDEVPLPLGAADIEEHREAAVIRQPGTRVSSSRARLRWRR